ncbi:hypothetical protein ABKV19_000834 [Rosa sericea]
MSTLSLLLPLRNSSLRTLCSMRTSHRGGRSRALLEILALLIETTRPLLMLLPECQLSSLLVTEYSRRFVQCCQVFCPAKVLDFGAGTGSAFWALREVGPNSLEKVNLVEPSQSMQRAGQSLIQEREHDLVIAQKILLSSAGKKTVEYTVPLAEKTKDMAMFAGKTTLHYVGHVAVDLKDKATVVGWTAAHYATEAAVEGTKAAARLELKCTARRAGMELKCTAREAGGIY